jgi:alcohol dehydrogenase
MELRKFVAPEVIFGIDAHKMVGKYAGLFGFRNPLVVSDTGVQEAGWTGKILQNLKEVVDSYAVYAGVTPNPRDFEVMLGADIFREEKCDSIIAVGGGSVIDCAKGIGMVVSNNKHILEFEGVDQVKVPMPPLICIPTTGGTSADVSQFAIINNTELLTKIAIISKSVVPDVALIDPGTLLTMDSYLTACTGIDALVHAIEAIASNANSRLTDVHALEAIRLISQNLIPNLKDPDNLELRSNIMLGSLEAGLAFSNASLGAVHAMAHSLGGYKDLPHGECNALLLRQVVEFNFSAVPERYRLVGEAMGIPLKGLNTNQIKKQVLNTIDALKEKAGIESSLKARGVSSSDVPHLAKRAIKDACLLTNPRKTQKRDLEVIYEESI